MGYKYGAQMSICTFELGAQMSFARIYIFAPNICFLGGARFLNYNQDKTIDRRQVMI